MGRRPCAVVAVRDIEIERPPFDTIQLSKPVENDGHGHFDLSFDTRGAQCPTKASSGWRIDYLYSEPRYSTKTATTATSLLAILTVQP
jgi:hypothetical protein